MGEGDNPLPKYCVSEVLYFVQNAINTMTRMDILQICNNFYSDAEIEFAKNLLWNRCEAHIDRLRTRIGDEKKKLNISDIYDAVKKIDWNHCLIRFAACYANKVPPFDLNKCDLSVIKSDLLELRKAAETMKLVQLELAQVKTDIHDIKMHNLDSEKVRLEIAKEQVGTSYAEISKSATKLPKKNNKVIDDSQKMRKEGEWTQVNRRKTIIGKQTGSSIKTVSPKIVRYFHVTRLEPQTKSEQLVNYLKDRHVNVVEVEKLKAKYDSYASFKVRVTCDEVSQFDPLYGDDFWPDQALVRRFFLSKHNHGQ